jgi:hypothetical protein
MQVFANIPLKSMRRVSGRRQSTYFGGWFDVARLIGPECTQYCRGLGRNYIWADIEIGEELRAHADCIYQEDGTIRVQVWVNKHRKTLAAFLASGDREWNVKEMRL